jgi:Carboxypeptidase regulatory-like domain
MRRHLGLLVLLFTVGCDNAQLPAQPTAPLPAAMLPEFRLSGSVRDTASRPLGEARVEIIAGPNAGTATTTDERGRFRMPESFTGVITVRASKDGYAPETSSIPSSRALERLPAGGASNWDMSFDLAPLGPSVDLAGLHTLTLTADRACSNNLPEAARVRTYTATISSGFRSTSFNVLLSDAQFPSTLPCVGPPQSCIRNQFGIGVAGNFADMWITIVEQLAEAAYLAIDGWVAASFGPSGLTAPLVASFVFCPKMPEFTAGEYWACPADGNVQGVECNSDRHQISLQRR